LKIIGAITVLAILLYGGFGARSYAQDVLLVGQETSDIPWHVEADTLTYEKSKGVYIAKGNVTITRGILTIMADEVSIYEETEKAIACGNVLIISGQDRLSGERVELYLAAGTGTVYDGRLFIKEGHFYIGGEKIEKTGKDTYRIQEGTFTTCDGDCPDWNFSGKEVDITIEGYGKVKSAAFHIKGIPVLYSPYLIFPVKLKRQTGFLIPKFGYSDRYGINVNLPFFWAISDSMDATLYQNWMSRRGLMEGLEYRYVLDQESKGTFMFDYLNDKSNRLPQKTPRHRWWLRGKHDQSLPGGFTVRVDLDIVSDQEYLKDFNFGFTGFDRTKGYYEDIFGRSVEDDDEIVRTNKIVIAKDWEGFSLNGRMIYHDDIRQRWEDKDNNHLQTLPGIEFQASRQPLPGMLYHLYYTGKASYEYKWRKRGTYGHVFELYSRIYWPYKCRNMFSFEPSFGFRETAYLVERYQFADEAKRSLDLAGEGKRIHSREIYDIRGDLSTELYRIFSLKSKRVSKIKHAIIPKIVYQYIPKKDQSSLPVFSDKVDEKNILTYSLTNYLTAKVRKGEGKQPKLEQQQEPPYYYKEFCRLKLWQSFDINESRRERDPSEEARPFSDISGEMEADLFRYISFQGDFAWSPYDNAFNSVNGAIVLSDMRGNSLKLRYRYNRDLNREIDTSIALRLLDSLVLKIEDEYSLKDNLHVKGRIEATYTQQCWAITISYTGRLIDKHEQEHRAMVSFSLFGLGNTTES